MIRFTLNGSHYEHTGDDNEPLLWVLRDAAGLTGTKYGCGAGFCGACTVHINGVAQRACITPVSAVAALQVTTIEGLSKNKLHPVQQAWIEEDVSQCGYCQVGQIMNAAALLEQIPEPSDADIDQHQTNLCRCGTYARIRKAIHRAAKIKNSDVVQIVEPEATGFDGGVA
jgi:isoquinoline 1-oxidoreductase alpha subunit